MFGELEFLSSDFFRDNVTEVYYSEKVSHAILMLQPNQLPFDYNFVETMVFKDKQDVQKSGKQLRRSSPSCSCYVNKSIG